MPYTLDLQLECLPKSLNKSLRAHWSRQRREGKRFDLILALACRGKLPPSPLQKARVTITRCFSQTLDFDGLVGSLKPVVDALVTAGVLVDDNWNVTGPWVIDQKFRPKKEGPLLVIRVEEQALSAADLKRLSKRRSRANDQPRSPSGSSRTS